MNPNHNNTPDPAPARRRSWFRLIWNVFSVLAILVLAAWLALTLVSRSRPPTYTVHRGTLVLNLVKNGNIKSRKAVDLKSELEGQATILTLIPEGTYVTAADVKNGKVLVELDSPGLKVKFAQQQIACSSAEAAYADAMEAYDIQANQNQSDLQGGEMKLKFVKMDLQKQLGEKVAEKLMAAEVRNTTRPALDIPALVKDPEMGGATLQTLRQLQSRIELAGEELTRATTKLSWTKRLFEKRFVSADDVKADELATRNKTFDLDQAKTSLDLYLRYDFPKDTERLYGNYLEAKRELQRISNRSRSLMIQADARRKGLKASFDLQKSILDKLQTQINACTVRATSPGLIVYGMSLNDETRSATPLRIGAIIRQGQTLVSILDNREMNTEFKLPEAWVGKIKPGLRAEISVDSFPEVTLTGTVRNIAPLADFQDGFDTETRVFTTEISIDGVHSFLKTGMSAKVKIPVQRLENVLNVPAQTVVSQGGRKICYVVGPFGAVQIREVRTGMSADGFLEITAGLSAGESILFSPPRPGTTISGDAGPFELERKS